MVIYQTSLTLKFSVRNPVPYFVYSFSFQPFLVLIEASAFERVSPPKCSTHSLYLSYLTYVELTKDFSGFGGLVFSMLASGTQDRGFKPDRSRRIFSGVKNPQRASEGK
jgi:hypothetical protein